MSVSISILCTGTEILDGRIDETNSKFLITEFESNGFLVERVLACRDSESEIVSSIDFLLKSSAVLVISGGLGPTSDDLTREAVARFLGKQLQQDNQAVADLIELYKKRQRSLDVSNNKQAMFPAGARVLKNPVGTAAGFHCQFQDASGRTKHILVAPGVPHELKRMCADHFLPFLYSEFEKPKQTYSHTLRVFGRAESLIGELVEKKGVPADIDVSYRANYPEVIVKLSSRTAGPGLEKFAIEAKKNIGADFVFSESPQLGYDEIVHKLLLDSSKTISCAESCTGGMLGGFLTNLPGASRYFLGGIISYSNKIKVEALGVDPITLERFGAVSAEVAKMMADGAKRKLASDIAVSITGIAGPDGGSETKPVGTFFVGFAAGNQVDSFHCFASTSRKMFRTFACYTALDIIRRHLLGLELRPAQIIGDKENK